MKRGHKGLLAHKLRLALTSLAIMLSITLSAKRSCSPTRSTTHSPACSAILPRRNRLPGPGSGPVPRWHRAAQCANRCPDSIVGSCAASRAWQWPSVGPGMCPVSGPRTDPVRTSGPAYGIAFDPDRRELPASASSKDPPNDLARCCDRRTQRRKTTTSGPGPEPSTSCAAGPAEDVADHRRRPVRQRSRPGRTTLARLPSRDLRAVDRGDGQSDYVDVMTETEA